MSQAPQQTFAMNQKVGIHVRLIAADGTTEDTTTTLQVSSGSNPVATVAVDAVDKRLVWISGSSVQGSTVITVTSPGNADPLTIPVTTTAPINLSRVEFVSADPPVAK
jgi:hypothetical protein